MNIAIFGRKNGQVGSSHNNLKSLIQGFISAVEHHGHKPIIDEETFLNFFSGDEFGQKCYENGYCLKSLETADIGVVFGGDGTMLYLAKALSIYNLPLLGVNLGRLGFITDVPHDFSFNELLSIIEEKKYTVETRNMISIDIENARQAALNEIVITRSTGKIIDFKVYIDGEFAYQARADGLMISTPTGSTAYALSTGAPIIHPSARVIELIPIFPQTLSNRTLIINDTSIVEFELVNGDADILIDGNEISKLTSGDRRTISRSIGNVSFVHPNADNLKYSYYNTLREKLNWQHVPGTPRI